MRFRMYLWVMLVLCGGLSGDVSAEEYDFTIPEAEAKPYAFGGRLESRYIYHRLDDDAAGYRLNYYQDEPGADAHEWRALAEFSAGYSRGVLQAGLLTHHEFAHTYEEDEWTNDIYEGFVTLTPRPHLTLDAGKKRILWGKGYAWNPAGFLNRPKDPDDPALNLEGRTMLGVDLIKSFAAGRLANIGLTALLLPVIGDWANPELGDEGNLNTAVKVYLLWCDTDFDFIYVDGPDQPRSFGFAVARNLAENFEVHAEMGFRQDAPHIVIDAAGNARKTHEDQLSYLAGLRYLNAYDTTFIAEYYHNGAGYDRNELKDFFAYQETAYNQWQTTGDALAMQTADRLTRPYYRQRNFAQDYLYLKMTQQEPFDILYFNPWVATVVNLQDWSFTLQPGFSWAQVTNLEVNFRVGIPIGPAGSEFGEKQDAVRPELWVRYYF